MSAQKVFRESNFIIFTLALLFVFIAFKKGSYAQDDIIRIDTNLVTVPATVLDREGRYMANLKKEDFQIFENGVEQEIALFEPTEQPFTVLLLLDNSGSMTNNIPEMVRAANTFVSQLRPDDQLIAVTFSGGGTVNVLFKTTKVAEIRKGIKITPRSGDGTTTTYDAVDYALKTMKKIRGRKAIILFSDAELYGIYASAKGNLHDAEESEVLIYTIRFGSFSEIPPSYANKKYYRERVEEIDTYMKDLARKTSGRPYQIENIRDLEKTFASIAEELGRQYSLGYYPKQQAQAGEKRQIKVKMRQPNLIVRARDSYIVQSAKNK